MAEPLKYVYNQLFFDNLTATILKVVPTFDKEIFFAKIFDQNWKNLELKQRMRHIVLMLKEQLPVDYQKMIKLILKLVKQLQKDGTNEGGFEYMFLPEFVELFGLEYYDLSTNALESITQFTSCEFAVRPFIVKYPSQMMAQMLVWTKHQNHSVRRLASEGCRPRLPWAMALPVFKKDPRLVLPILEKLKNDSSEFVRRSVANNLNDIAKDNPQIVIDKAKKWIGKTKETDKLVKHACRTLLKQGNTEIMALFGFGDTQNMAISKLKVLCPQIKIGDYLLFEFQLINKATTAAKIRLEYGIYYQKANGTLSKKVFKISEKTYAANSTTAVSKRQSFKPITTRKFHLGKHQVSIIVNGVSLGKVDFELV